MFTDDYAARIRERYRARPSCSRPPHYVLTTALEREQQRRWLSVALEALPANPRARFITRLESPRSFLSAYNKLAAMAVMCDREVRRQLRLVLKNNSLPPHGELFGRAYEYIAEHY